MMEGEIAPVDEELQSLAHLVTRQHSIVLCCAHSVAELVEEVARNLSGLGFDVEVVCGAEARSALLGRNDRRDEPTIYVVCVQGTLKEQVLKPLRQALATHGGPNQHLFVAVLDLALPLAMVGQIRRFAEALERPGGKGGGINERRQWREHVGPNGPDRVPTRAYRAVEVLERTTGSHPSVDATTTTRTGPQTVIGSARPAKVGVTAKYKAVTGQLPAVSGEVEQPPEPAGRRRRKTHAPKVRVKPIAPARTRRGDAPVDEVTPPPAAIEAAAPAAEDEDDPSAELRAPVAAADIDASMSASWGTAEEPDTIVRPRAPDTFVPPPLPPARTGDTVIAPPPAAPREESAKADERAPSRRGETVLYTEAGDQPVILPLPPPDPPTPTARGNTVIGQAPTRFRATPVATPRTMIGLAPPSTSETVVPPPPSSSPTARGDTVVAPPPSSSPTVRGDTAVGPAPSAPTLRGDTVVGPPPSSSPTARGDTVVAPPPSSPTARAETVIAPPPVEPSSATARGQTVVPTPPKGKTLPPEEIPAVRGQTLVPTPEEPKPEEPKPVKRDTVVPEPRARIERTPSVPTPIETRDEVAPPRRSKLPIVIGVLAIAGAGVLAWSMGWFGGGASAPTATSGDTKIAKSEPAKAEPAKSEPAKAEPAKAEPAKAESAKAEPAKTEPTPTPAEPTPTPAEPPEPTPAEPTPTPAEPTPAEPPTPTPAEPAEPPTPSEPTATSTPIDSALASAVASRRVRLTEYLYVATQRDEPTTYSDARAICRKLDVDGVTGWRLPYRRELRAADIAGWLRDDAYWSRTRPDDEAGSVYVILHDTGELTVRSKDELASVTCVKKR